MIITISGAACTGKTTLLDRLQERTKDRQDIIYFGEFIREMFDKSYQSKYKDFTNLLQGDPIDIIDIHKETAKLFNEILWSVDSNNNILVFDRSPLDISIYLYMNLMDYLSKDEKLLDKYREASNYLYRCSNSFMSHNPIMYYTRPFNATVVDDGFRPVSLLSRRSLELSLFDKEFLSTPNVIVLPSDLDERANIILTKIIKNS